MGKMSICLVKHNAKRTGAVRAPSIVVDFAPPMFPSSVMAATRAFVKVILALAQLYGLVLWISKDSSSAEVKVAYRKLRLDLFRQGKQKRRCSQDLPRRINVSLTGGSHPKKYTGQHFNLSCET